ncbi:MAG: glutamine-hydrolyzing carbamoyl-phosphate synthase small subunit [Alphaproteobacteria bacterium]|nr:glutamine-hydrolyzing carbamoyl-phosphate synthase small subunit [Alphaproteobacteria bacterium]
MFASSKPAPTRAVLVLADGSVFGGRGIGATGLTGGEICFNTGMTGYQEVMTDPSYAGQIITFTFPHIGNTGANSEDNEAKQPFAKGLVVREDITPASNYRSEVDFNDWLIERNITGICGIDTRALTHHLRNKGAQNGVICHAVDIDLDDIKNRAKALPDMTGRDLAAEVSCSKPYMYGDAAAEKHVVVVDYGVKRSILDGLVAQGLRLTVVPCRAAAQDIMGLKPDGVFLSNGPGDPAATGTHAVPLIRDILKSGLPLFGICLGHQLLALTLGARTEKLPFGHRGVNHPVKNVLTGQVEITSQNHGFHVIADSLPDGVEVTHTSLFDGTNEGLQVKGRPVFSVQYHPEASPGPHDSHYLFRQFAELVRIDDTKKATAAA